MARENLGDASRTRPVIEDAEILTPRKRWIRRYGKWVLPTAISFVAATVWLVEHFYLAPQRDDRIVAEALQLLAANLNDKKWYANLLKMPLADQRLEVLEDLKPSEKDRTDPKAQKTYKAVLQVAAREGIPEGKLEFGKALRDGLIGEKDSIAALKVFDEMARELDAGVRTGDPVSMVVRAQMLSEGLGIEPDLEKARDLARRAGPGLTGLRLQKLARAAAFGTSMFKGSNDFILTELLASRMIDKKMSMGPVLGATWTCGDYRKSNFGPCYRKWYERGATAGIVSAMAPYGGALLADGVDLEIVDLWFEAGDLESSSHQRYEHSVLRAMLAKTDEKLFQAIRDMQQHLAVDAIEFKWAPEASLNEKFLGLNNFEKSLKTSTGDRFDNFLVALRVRGLLTERFGLYEEVFLWLRDRPDLQRRFGSAALIRKSELIAKALKEGSPIAATSLPSPAEPKMRNATKSVAAPGVMAQNNPPEKTKDSEEQDKTGYIKGQPQKATGGMSNFTVDNLQGSSDAVARVYLDGMKPAVRSMYVKKGEKFLAQSLKPGTYVFRYRFIGSDDTFESDKSFVLTETKTETGTRYSTVTVTLFKVRAGNMTSRKVDPSTF